VATGAAARTPPPAADAAARTFVASPLMAGGRAAAVPRGRQPTGSTGADDRRGDGPPGIADVAPPPYPAPRSGGRQ